ncbi:MAG TPA: Gfo/Idh/MocA family oxidoreductase [Candidatus Limnocylindrales bacterium]|nr:Gfo/Idh/MocA family oxidoreductase [Candidatus Limnocylindrales bacterium]
MRFGLIGCGGIGSLRAAALKQVPEFRLEAVSDIDLDRARMVSIHYGGIVVPDWRSLVHREEVEAVIISTPPHFHAEMCREALKAGKHVLCEKPLARTPDECQSILEVEKQSGRFLATGFNYRFYPSIQKARKLLDSGIIGTLDHIRSYTGYSAAEHNQSWLHESEIMGGGAFRDNGIHLIDLTCYFLGEVAEVKGFATNGVWEFKGCEDNGFALLRSTTGKIASLQASWTEWRGYRLSIEIYGTRGCIRTRCFPMLTQVLWSPERGGPIRRKTYFFPLTFIQEHLRSYRWIVIRSFIQEFQAFSRAIRGERTELATGYDGLRAVEIAYAASRTFLEG